MQQCRETFWVADAVVAQRVYVAFTAVRPTCVT